MIRRLWLSACLWLTLVVPGSAADPIKILFLGDNGHHRPGDRAAQLIPALKDRGVEIKYTDDVGVLKAETLNQFDGLLLFANIDNIEKEAADALLASVESGKGFIPVHCASYCFRNDDRIVALMGGQFQRHGTGVFRTRIVQPNDPIMKGFDGFASWDETYVHTKHNEKTGSCSKSEPMTPASSRTRGPARKAKAASSTQPGDMMSGPGDIPGS
jgi:type 1 glutamine amidotransferase